MNKFFELQFEIETACLLDCIHCSSANSRLLTKRQYSDEDILRLLELFHGKIRVILTGGEPLLYKHVFELCKQISLKSLLSKIGIYTTGNIKNMRPIDEPMAHQLKALQVDECYFSIYSTSAELHDTWTKKARSFSNTIDSVTNLKKAGISSKAHLVLNKYNINSVKKIIHFCKSIGMDEVRILKLAPAGNAQINWDNISLPLSTQNNVIKQIISNRNEFTISITVAGYPKIMPCRNFPNAKGCQAGLNLLYIDSYGDVYPCACTKANAEKFKICNIVEIGKLKNHLYNMSKVECYADCLNSII